MALRQQTTPSNRRRGPAVLFLAWSLHDVEEALKFPATCDYVADRTGWDSVRIDSRQAWVAVGLMGTFVGFACLRGARTGGSSRLYRAVTAGLEAHVLSHLAVSALTRRYTAGVLSAVPVMLPGAKLAGRELARDGVPLTASDRALGAVVLIPAALVCHLTARAVLKRR